MNPKKLQLFLFVGLIGMGFFFISDKISTIMEHNQNRIGFVADTTYNANFETVLMLSMVVIVIIMTAKGFSVYRELKIEERRNS